MDPELALYINYVLDPRDKMDMTLTAKETHCKIADKMLSLPEIGMGLTLEDLNGQSIKRRIVALLTSHMLKAHTRREVGMKEPISL